MTERMVLGVIYENCTGCRLCELACSLKHEGKVSPALSRIKVITTPELGVAAPVYCVQCKDAACYRECPVKAIEYNEGLGVYKINYDKCVGCRKCMYVCPIGAVSLGSDGKPIKCDLCNGDPACVKVCPHDALVYGRESEVMEKIRESRVTSVLYKNLMKKIEQPGGEELEKVNEALQTLYKLWEKKKEILKL